MRVRKSRLVASTRSALSLVLVVCLASVFSGCGGGHPRAPVSASVVGKSHTIRSRVCERNPRDGVQTPDRLQLLSRCAAFEGTVIQVHVKSPHDGDLSFNVKPDPGYGNMLNGQNRSEGGLHVEIVPRDQPGCTPGKRVHVGHLHDLGLCSGRDLSAPHRGAHVRIIGPWVFDRNNAWYEIHPAWSIKPARRAAG